MNLLAIFHFEQCNQEEPQTTQAKCVIHGCELACVDEETEPYAEMDGAEKDGFKFLEVEEMHEFLCLVFCDTLFVHEERDEVECDNKKPPSILCKVLHSPMSAHDPTWNGCH